MGAPSADNSLKNFRLCQKLDEKGSARRIHPPHAVAIDPKPAGYAITLTIGGQYLVGNSSDRNNTSRPPLGETSIKSCSSLS